MRLLWRLVPPQFPWRRELRGTDSCCTHPSGRADAADSADARRADASSAHSLDAADAAGSDARPSSDAGHSDPAHPRAPSGGRPRPARGWIH
jgi:hypothetical protein